MSTRKKPKLTARATDKHWLYEQSVQAPDTDAPFLARYYRRYRGETARRFREDFCGTATLASHWVKLHRDNRATGIDLCGKTLDWGRRHNVDALTEPQQRRIRLIEADVRNVDAPAADICCALNFSYSVFKSRDVLRGYFEHVRRGLAPGGLFLVDAWGGSQVQSEQEERRRVGKFVYVWDQHSFDPVTHDIECRIHFEFPDGTSQRSAFVYHWRLWTLPELRELMTEAGFRDVHVLWEGTDRETGEGNGVFRRVTKGDADDAWIAYVVGAR